MQGSCERRMAVEALGAELAARMRACQTLPASTLLAAAAAAPLGPIADHACRKAEAARPVSSRAGAGGGSGPAAQPAVPPDPAAAAPRAFPAGAWRVLPAVQAQAAWLEGKLRRRGVRCMSLAPGGGCAAPQARVADRAECAGKDHASVCTAGACSGCCEGEDGHCAGQEASGGAGSTGGGLCASTPRQNSMGTRQEAAGEPGSGAHAAAEHLAGVLTGCLELRQRRPAAARGAAAAAQPVREPGHAWEGAPGCDGRGCSAAVRTAAGPGAALQLHARLAPLLAAFAADAVAAAALLSFARGALCTGPACAARPDAAGVAPAGRCGSARCRCGNSAAAAVGIAPAPPAAGGAAGAALAAAPRDARATVVAARVSRAEVAGAAAWLGALLAAELGPAPGPAGLGGGWDAALAAALVPSSHERRQRAPDGGDGGGGGGVCGEDADEWLVVADLGSSRLRRGPTVLKCRGTCLCVSGLRTSLWVCVAHAGCIASQVSRCLGTW